MGGFTLKTSVGFIFSLQEILMEIKITEYVICQQEALYIIEIL